MGIPALTDELLSPSKATMGWNDAESMTGRAQKLNDFTFLARVGLTVLLWRLKVAETLEMPAAKRLMATSAVVREKSMVVAFAWMERALCVCVCV